MAEEIVDNWTHILINGKSKTIEVKDAEFDKGKLINISEIKNHPKLDADNKEIKHTAELANNEKRKVYSSFFQKPFKNLIILTGAGSSMDVKGLSMAQLWDEAVKEFKTEEVDGLNNIIEAVKFPKEKTEKKDIEALLSQVEGFIKFSEDKDIVFKLLREVFIFGAVALSHRS